MAGKHDLHSQSKRPQSESLHQHRKIKAADETLTANFQDMLNNSKTVSALCPKYSPVVRLVNYEDSLESKVALSSSEDACLAGNSPSHGVGNGEDLSDKSRLSQNCLYKNVDESSVVCTQTEIASHDVSDESGIEEPELPISGPPTEQDVVMTTRQSSRASICTDSGSESPDATNIIPSPPPNVETCLRDDKDNQHSTDVNSRDGKTMHYDDNMAPSPSMPCLELEMPILTMEEPVAVTAEETESRLQQECSTTPDSSDTVKSCSTRTLFTHKLDLSSTVSSTSDETKDFFFEQRKSEVKSECVDSSCIEDLQTADKTISSHANQTKQSEQAKNFVKEFHKFCKNFDAKKVVKSVSEDKNKTDMQATANLQDDRCKTVMKEEIEEQRVVSCAVIGVKRDGEKPVLSTVESEAPATLISASPRRKSRMSFHEVPVNDASYVAPLFFTPQNPYEMFINAYWAQHFCDHPTKEQVRSDADMLWKRTFCADVDPGFGKLWQYLDDYNERQDKRAGKNHASSSLCTRRRSTESQSSTSDRGKYKRRSSCDGPSVKKPYIKSEDETEASDCNVQNVQVGRPRPKRRRISNMKYDADEFAIGNMSELDDIPETADGFDESEDVMKTLSAEHIDMLYKNWQPPSDIDIGGFLANTTLLSSLKHKVVELLRIVFPALDYSPRLVTSESMLAELLKQIEEAVNDQRDPTSTPCDNIDQNGSSNCRILLCRDPSQCLHDLRQRVCDFLCVILPDLTLDDSFDRTSDCVEEMLAEIVASNKQAFQSFSSAYDPVEEEEGQPGPNQECSSDGTDILSHQANDEGEGVNVDF